MLTNTGGHSVEIAPIKIRKPNNFIPIISSYFQHLIFLRPPCTTSGKYDFSICICSRIQPPQKYHRIWITISVNNDIFVRKMKQKQSIPFGAYGYYRNGRIAEMTLKIINQT